MKLKNQIISLLSGLICGVLSYWFHGATEMYAFGLNIYMILGVSTFISAFGIGFIKRIAYLHTPILICAGFVIAALARIFYDVILDSTSHNLFPFEILFLLVIGTPCAFAGWWLVDSMNKKMKKNIQ